MRSENEIYQLILDVAQRDDRIRAVVLNGSRANPNAPRDIFQDFDIVYIVTEVQPFRNNQEWIKRFGELMILQVPEDMDDPPGSDNGSFTYLMQFSDGNRIDLNLFPLTSIDHFYKDSLSVLLLDKDGVILPFAPPDESDYLPEHPTAKGFSDCCNEFWWVSAYVAKGLWREEIIYAQHMMDHFMRHELMKVLVWYIGAKTHFSCNPGKFGKYFNKYLEPDLWELLQGTFTDAGYDHTWEALFKMCRLFRITALALAESFGFEYPIIDDWRVYAHLQHIRFLPKDASEIYA